MIIIDRFKRIFYDFASAFVKFLPSWLFADAQTIRKKYCGYCDKKNSCDITKDAHIHTAGNYLMILLVFTVLFILTQISRYASIEDTSGNKEVYKVVAEYDGTRVCRAVRPDQIPLTATERENSLWGLDERLRQYIKGKNIDLDHVEFDLNLPEKEEKTGIFIRWFSDNPDVLDEKGNIDSIAASEGAQVVLTANAHSEDIAIEIPFDINIMPLKGRDHTKALNKRLSRISDVLSKKAAEGDILPEQLEEGIRITWHSKTANPVPALMICLCALLFLAYYFRYEKLKRKKKEVLSSIRSELPDFVDKLILLLNAGLVTEAAIRKIIKDYQKYREDRIKPLYEGLWEAERRASATNSSLIREIRAFARDSEVKEFMSFTAILSDNIDKGGSLAEKLGGEAAFLWFARKKRAQEKARLAETKLALPLMLQLLVLILITVAPIMIKI